MKKWSKITWMIWAWTALMAFGVYLAIVVPGSNCTPEQSFCPAFRHVASVTLIAGLFVLWFVGFLVLMILWSRGRGERLEGT